MVSLLIQDEYLVPIFRNQTTSFLLKLFPPMIAQSPSFPDFLLAFSAFLSMPFLWVFFSSMTSLRPCLLFFSLLLCKKNATLSGDRTTPLVTCNLHNSTCYMLSCYHMAFKLLICVCVLVIQSCPILCDPYGLKPALPMEFTRQEYWSG